MKRSNTQIFKFCWRKSALKAYILEVYQNQCKDVFVKFEGLWMYTEFFEKQRVKEFSYEKRETYLSVLSRFVHKVWGAS